MARPKRPRLHETQFGLSDWMAELALITLDYESYYAQDYGLRVQGTSMSDYVRDERWRTHMVGIKINDELTDVVMHKDIPKALKQFDWRKCAMLAHNTAFDGLVSSHHYGVVPAFYFDTLSMARALHSNEIGAGLDEVAPFYGVGNKMEDVITQMKGHRILPPEIEYKGGLYCGMDVELCHKIFFKMLPQFPTNELELIDITIRAFADPVLKVDVPRARKELIREIEHKRKVYQRITGKQTMEAGQELIRKDEWFANALRENGVEPPVKYSEAKSKRAGHDVYAYAFAKTDEDFTNLSFHPNDDVCALVEARLESKSTGTIARAQRLLDFQREPDWCVPVMYNYYLAISGRWSGGNKTNFQNFERGGELRKSLLAPKGYVVLTADSSQIEARMNAWFWGYTDLLDVFTSGDCAYCHTAEGIFNEEVVKGRSDRDDDMRQVGKVALLALGYQGAVNALLKMAKSMGIMPVMLKTAAALGFKSVEQFAMKIVKQYRLDAKPIVDGWKAMESVLFDMLTRRKGTVGEVLEIEYEPGHFWMPNGISIKLPGLKAEEVYDDRAKGYSYRNKLGTEHIYGGKFNNYLIQGLARHVVADQIRLVSQELRAVMTTHDEGSWLARESEADDAKKFVEEIFRTPPAWAATLPVSSEVKYDIYYCK